jgi:hypothetical protein
MAVQAGLPGLASTGARQAEVNVFGGCMNVLVRRQQGQVAAEAELDEEGVDGSFWLASRDGGRRNLPSLVQFRQHLT